MFKKKVAEQPEATEPETTDEAPAEQEQAEQKPALPPGLTEEDLKPVNA